MDKTLNPSVILSLDYVIVTQAKDEVPWKSDSAECMRVLVQGDKRLYEYVAPSGMSGTKLLILAPEKAYVYLPDFGKVRTVILKSEPAGFVGMFAVQDLGGANYSTLYSAQVTQDDEATCILKLTPKPDKKTPYPCIELTIDKSVMLPAKIEYFDTQGTKIKTETRRRYDTKDGVSTPRQIRMTDYRAEGDTTTYYLLDWEILAELPPETFTTKGLIPVPVND
ncbi:MAG: outer membrane lipoprotein-sorting protein [Opitutae bacterium]|nr:outer membrane lipoprotein-sorting protein [Opitutae bacterium]